MQLLTTLIKRCFPCWWSQVLATHIWYQCAF